MKQYFLMFITAFVLFGCGSTGKGKQEYDVSQKLVGSGKYMEAVAYLERALQKEPDNENYVQQLQKAKRLAADGVVAEVQQAAMKPQLMPSEIQQLEAKIATAKSLNANHPQLGNLERLLQNKKQLLADNVQTLYASAQRLIAEENWQAAYFSLQKVQALYPNYEQTQPLLNDVRKKGVQQYLSSARDAFVDFELDDALLWAQKARAISANQSNINSFINEISTANQLPSLLEQGQQSLNAQEWDKLVKICAAIIKLDRLNPSCQDWVILAEQQIIIALDNETQSFLRSGYIIRALSNLDKIHQVASNTSSDRIQNLQMLVMNYANDQVTKLTEQGFYGTAWYLKKASEKYEFDALNSFDQKKKLEDKIRQRVTKSIAVFDFKSPSYNEDAGVLIANKLIANLFNNAGKDTNILERENLKSILEEMKLGQIGVVSQETAKEMGRVYGIDIAIMGSVLLFKVDESSSQSSETVRYVVGEEIQDNIDFLNWKAVNPNPSSSDLKAAPQPKIMVPKYAEKEYDVTHAKKVGFIEVSFRIVDVVTGANTRVETIETKKILEDKANEGVKDAGVEFNPLEMLTDTELLQMLAEEVVEELSRKVLGPLRNRERVYLDKGIELLEVRKEDVNAMESFVDALFNEKVKSTVNSPVADAANDYLGNIAESHRFVL